MQSHREQILSFNSSPTESKCLPLRLVPTEKEQILSLKNSPHLKESKCFSLAIAFSGDKNHLKGKQLLLLQWCSCLPCETVSVYLFTLRNKGCKIVILLYESHYHQIKEYDKELNLHA